MKKKSRMKPYHPYSGIVPAKLCKPSLTSAFNEARWREDHIIQLTNCYAYALGCHDMARAQPGNLAETEHTNFELSSITVEKLRELLKKDGLIEISEDQALSGKFHAIALRVEPQIDFHFYRRDAHGIWSHKLGKNPVTDRDDMYEPVYDPKTAILNVQNKYTYKKFGGYFTIPEKGISYIPRFPFNMP